MLVPENRRIEVIELLRDISRSMDTVCIASNMEDIAEKLNTNSANRLLCIVYKNADFINKTRIIHFKNINGSLYLARFVVNILPKISFRSDHTHIYGNLNQLVDEKKNDVYWCLERMTDDECDKAKIIVETGISENIMEIIKEWLDKNDRWWLD
jgi:hypothetical protein